MSRKILSLALTLLLACISLEVFSQTVSVSGVVVDESELPVIGAAVIVKGTDIGTATDENGRFSFNNIPFYGLNTYHDDDSGYIRGFNTMYRFTFEDMTFCHCGDIGDIPSGKVINAIKEVDFLFVPVGGTYTMENPELRKFIELVNPRIIIPMHYRFGGLTIPVKDVDHFLQMIPEESIDYVGNSIDITKDELPEYKECWVFDRN